MIIHLNDFMAKCQLAALYAFSKAMIVAWDANIAKAGLYLFYEWKWKESYTALQKAMKLNPIATAACQLLGFY